MDTAGTSTLCFLQFRDRIRSRLCVLRPLLQYTVISDILLHTNAVNKHFFLARCSRMSSPLQDQPPPLEDTPWPWTIREEIDHFRTYWLNDREYIESGAHSSFSWWSIPG